MRLLFIGDLVGPAAVPFATDAIARIRSGTPIDLVVVNAENAAHDPATGRYGTSPDMVAALLAGGVDVVTGGNHTWDRPDAAEALAHPRVLRPLNVPADHPGYGSITLDVGGEPVTVVNLIDAAAYAAATPIWPAWQNVNRRGTVIVDLHAAMPVDKRAFAWAVAGEVAAVLGTHTHEPSLLLDILPGGTAFVAEVGFTGPSGGAGGGDARQAAASLRGDRDPAQPSALAGGPMTLAAVLVTIDTSGDPVGGPGRATAIERFS